MTSAILTATQHLNMAIDEIDKIADVVPRGDDDAVHAAAHEVLAIVDRHAIAARDAIEKAMERINIERCEILARIERF